MAKPTLNITPDKGILLSLLDEVEEIYELKKKQKEVKTAISEINMANCHE